MMIMQKRNNLPYEITGLLILKICLLWVIWYFCFSEPIDNHDDAVMSQKVTSHFLSSSLQPPSNKKVVSYD